MQFLVIFPLLFAGAFAQANIIVDVVNSLDCEVAADILLGLKEPVNALQNTVSGGE